MGGGGGGGGGTGLLVGLYESHELAHMTVVQVEPFKRNIGPSLSTYLIHRAHSYLALGGRQPFGFRVIPEYVVETVRGRLEVPRRLKIGTVDNFTLSSENVKKESLLPNNNRFSSR